MNLSMPLLQSLIVIIRVSNDASFMIVGVKAQNHVYIDDWPNDVMLAKYKGRCAIYRRYCTPPITLACV